MRLQRLWLLGCEATFVLRLSWDRILQRGNALSKTPFKTDSAAIRKRARAKMSGGAVTAATRADVAAVVAVLNEVLATEIVCNLRYRNHSYNAHGIHSEAIAAEFLEHAAE